MPLCGAVRLLRVLRDEQFASESPKQIGDGHGHAHAHGQARVTRETNGEKLKAFHTDTITLECWLGCMSNPRSSTLSALFNDVVMTPPAAPLHKCAWQGGAKDGNNVQPRVHFIHPPQVKSSIEDDNGSNNSARLVLCSNGVHLRSLAPTSQYLVTPLD
jgi:hypothetical protein